MRNELFLSPEFHTKIGQNTKIQEKIYRKPLVSVFQNIINLNGYKMRVYVTFSKKLQFRSPLLPNGSMALAMFESKNKLRLS